jgi:hypothetical protein
MIHLVNVLRAANLSVLAVAVGGGTLLYVGRRVSGNLYVPIILLGLYDTAFYLRPGKNAVGEKMPGFGLAIQLEAFLMLMLTSIPSVIICRRFFKQEGTGQKFAELRCESEVCLKQHLFNIGIG